MAQAFIALKVQELSLGCIMPRKNLALGMYNKIPIYPVFYLLKGDYRLFCRVIKGLGFVN